MSAPLAYFITFSTYGSWLHGRATGSVDLKNNAPGTQFLQANPALERQSRAKMRQEPYLLDPRRRQVVLKTILEVAAHRKWHLWAVHVRSNHVHVVVTADCKPEKVMIDLKAWASRRLREQFDESPDRDRWTEHGSTQWLNDEEDFQTVVKYVLDEQGEPMERHDGR
ncbi:MAG: transposase [Fimbriiglobus sp.]